MLLVRHHVLQALVEHWTDEDRCVDLLARHGIVENVVSVRLIPQRLQLLADARHVQVSETGTVAQQTQLYQHLAQKRLLQLTNSHARRNGMRIDNNVRTDSRFGEGHVLLGNDIADGSLLSMPTAKLVPKCGLTLRSEPHFGEGVPITVAVEVVAIHVGVLVRAIHAALVLVHNHLRGVVAVLLDRRHLRYDDIAVLDERVLVHQSVRVYLVIVGELCPLGLGRIGFATDLLVAIHLLLVLVFLRMVNSGLEEPAIHRPLVEQERILLVVARVRHDSHHDIGPRGDFHQFDDVHQASIYQGTRWIVQNVGRLVHALQIIGDVYTHRLLTHSTLISVPGRLVVLGERNTRSQDAEDGARVDLTVRVAV